MRKLILSSVGLALVFLALNYIHAKPAAGGQENPSKEIQVKIDNFSFSPSPLNVPVGSTVTWTNQDDVPHNVRSSEGNTLKSPVLDTDQKFSFTFNKAGTYQYFCAIHPKMTGKVVVQ
jgi:amicyanin